MTRTAIIVLGMHRSGTSALAGVLNCLGVTLGPRLLAGEADVNERGFWEHAEIVEIHDALLGLLGSRWHDILPLPEGWNEDERVEAFRRRLVQVVVRDFSRAALWAVKDPRMCRLAPLWLEILDEAGVDPVFIHIYRHPFEVVRSLEKRDRMTPAKALFLWLDHNLQAEFFTRGYARVFVSYSAVLTQPRATIARIGKYLGLTWPRPLDEATDDIDAFLTPNLRHYVVEDSFSDTAIGPDDDLAAETLSTLDEAAKGESRRVRAAFDSLHEQFARRVAAFDPVLLSHIDDIERHRARLEWRLELANNSLSMRITRPLRAVSQAIRGISGKQKA